MFHVNLQGCVWVYSAFVTLKSNGILAFHTTGHLVEPKHSLWQSWHSNGCNIPIFTRKYIHLQGPGSIFQQTMLVHQRVYTLNMWCFLKGNINLYHKKTTGPFVDQVDQWPVTHQKKVTHHPPPVTRLLEAFDYWPSGLLSQIRNHNLGVFARLTGGLGMAMSPSEKKTLRSENSFRCPYFSGARFLRKGGYLCLFVIIGNMKG